MTWLKLPSNLRALFIASFASSLGSGLTLPFLLIYLHQVRGISLAASGFLVGAVGVLALPAAPAAGAAVDRFGARSITIVALTIQALGTAALILAHSARSAVLPVAIYGIGVGAAAPTWFALLGNLINVEEMRPRIFALNSQLVNLGLGLGSLIAGFVVHVSHPSSFVVVYLADGATTLVIVAILGAQPSTAYRRGRPENGAPSASDSHPGFRQVFIDRRMRRYLPAALLLAVAGYGSINAGFVGFATTITRVTPRTIALAFAVNTGFIVIAQPVGAEVAIRIRRSMALMLVAVFFAASWVVVGLGFFVPGSMTGDILTILALLVFGMGEILLSPVWAPLVTRLAPAELQGRYIASAGVAFSMASIVGPPIAGSMLAAGFPLEYLGLLLACCAGSIVGFRKLRGALTPDEDNARGRASAGLRASLGALLGRLTSGCAPVVLLKLGHQCDLGRWVTRAGSSCLSFAGCVVVMARAVGPMRRGRAAGVRLVRSRRCPAGGWSISRSG